MFFFNSGESTCSDADLYCKSLLSLSTFIYLMCVCVCCCVCLPVCLCVVVYVCLLFVYLCVCLCCLFQEILSGGERESCTPQNLGLLLIYHLHVLQALDQLRRAPKGNMMELEATGCVSALHTLYTMTLTPIGQ